MFDLLLDASNANTISREAFGQMARELQEGDSSLGDVAAATASGSIGRAGFEAALVEMKKNTHRLREETAGWWLGLRQSGAVELLPQQTSRAAAASAAAAVQSFRVEAAEVAQMGTLLQLREDVECGLRQPVALDTAELRDGLAVLRGDAEFASVATVEVLVRGLGALDYLQVATLPPPVVARLVSWTAVTVTEAAAAAAKRKEQKSEQLVEEVRAVVQRTSFGTAVWAGLLPAVRLAGLRLPLPMTPDLQTAIEAQRDQAKADEVASDEVSGHLGCCCWCR